MTSKWKARLKLVAQQLIRLLFFGREGAFPAQLLSNPARILLVNGAHVGDIVMSTALLGSLRSAFPHAEIGFVVGSWSKMVVAEHPNVDFVHTVDHWKSNRSRDSFLVKYVKYVRTRTRALKEIRARRYDIAICSHAYYSDLLSLVWQADVPVRVAFEQSIFAPLANVTARYPESPFVQQRECLAALLRAMSLDETQLSHCRAELAPDSFESTKELCDLLQLSDLHAADYFVIHIGSGAPARELPSSTWRAVVAELSREHLLLFTGRGAREKAEIRKIIAGFPNCVDACDRLSWRGLVTAIRHAARFYGVESMAGHVAAAVGTRSVLAYSGMAGVARWRPDTSLAMIWTHNVSCSPCGNMKGCKHMACVRRIMAKDLVASASTESDA